MDIPFHVSQQHQLAGKKNKKKTDLMWEDLLAWSVKLHNAPICSRGYDSCVIIFPTTDHFQSSSSHLVTLQVIG